jgi:1,2-diacylglycerol 3-alpha-glucosyltransferase
MPHYNIAFYSDTYLPAMDGVVNSMLNFKRELERRGNKVYIFSSKKGMRGRGAAGASKDVFLYPGVDFKPYPQYSVAVFPYHSLLKLRSLDIDLIHAQTPFVMGFNGLMAAKLGRYPLVGSYHTMIGSKSLAAYYPKNRMLKKFYSTYIWKYTKFFYNRCDATIAPSRVIESLLRRHDIKNTALVPNSIDTKRFSPKVDGSAMRERLGIGDGDRMVLYLGRISTEKKIEVMLRAAKSIRARRKDVSFVIGGTGPALEHYHHMAKRLGILDSVKFLGFVGDKSLPSLYAASDALCIPSTFETQGIVSLEAMACGKPVVAADYLALHEIVENGRNGERFQAGNYIACAKKIEKVLNNCESYKKQALSTANDFSVGKVTDRLLKVYDSVSTKQAFF